MGFRFSSLASGSSGNCQYIETENMKILLDIGLSGKRTEGLLEEIGVKAEDLDAIFVTHEHTDHSKGVGIVSRRYNLPIYASAGTWKNMGKAIGEVDKQNKRVIKGSCKYTIKDLEIKPFTTSHDAAEPVGYCFSNNNKKISILTDTGFVDDKTILELNKSDFLMLESNHDSEMLKIGSYPAYLKRRVSSNIGHLSNDQAGNTIKNIDLKNSAKILLGHLSKENNSPELAFQTIQNILYENKKEELISNIIYKNKFKIVYEI